MKGKIMMMLLFVVLFLVAVPTSVKAEEQPRLHQMQASAYCLKGQMSDGSNTRPGVCAGKREWLGKTIAVYYNNNGIPGEFLGYYTVCDTGKDQRLKNGQAVDIWLPTYAECKEFGRPDVIVVFVG